MIALLIRLTIGLIVSLILFGGTLYLLKVAPDRYLPPPLEYSHTNATSQGMVTDTEDRGYVDHWWAGMDNQYFVDYTFQAAPMAWDPKNPTVSAPAGPAQAYTASVRITQDDYHNVYRPNQSITVTYDPYNPNINGIQGTLGGYSRGSGYYASYLWYVAGVLLLTIIFGEVSKKWLPSD